MRSCNLECVKKGKRGGGEDLEFVGPVKIVLVDRSNAKEYIRIIWYAAMIGIAEMMLATATTIAQFFSMGYNKKFFMKGLHALFATIGLQACLFSGVLVMNSSSGAAAPVRVSDRKKEHVCVQSCALLFGAVAAGSAYFAGFKSIMTLHSILGLTTWYTCGFVATGLALLTGLSGLFLSDCCRLSNENESFGAYLYIHLITGIFSCIVSSMCFVSGMTSDIFLKWLPLHEMYTYMVLCCAAYTTIIVYKPMIMIFTGRRDSVAEY